MQTSLLRSAQSILALLLVATLLSTIGCHVKSTEFTGEISVTDGKWGGKLGFKAVVQAVGKDYILAAPHSGYTVIYTLPTNAFSLSTTSTAEATLTATSDSGYTSSTVVTLTPVSATSASGYTSYAFSVPDSTALETWVEQVSSNTISTLTFTADTAAFFTPKKTSGTYPASIKISSNQTGIVDEGSTYLTLDGIGDTPVTCETNVCPNIE